jgi:hypothetical protein
VKARQQQQSKVHKARGLGPKYLFSSLLQCGCCGGGFIITHRDSYGCGRRKDRGPTVCDNHLTIKRDWIETALLDGLRNDLLAPEYVDVFKEEVARVIRDMNSSPEKPILERRLSTTRKEIDNLMRAIKAGIYTSTTKDELERLEADKASLEQQIQAMAPEVLAMLPRAIERYKSMVAELNKSLCRTAIPKAREYIRQLVGNKIIIKPDESGEYLKAEFETDYARMLSIGLVAGAGFTSYRHVYSLKPKAA